MNPGRLKTSMYARPSSKRCDAHHLKDRASTRLADLMSGGVPRVDTVLKGWLTPERRMGVLRHRVEKLEGRIEELKEMRRPTEKLTARRDRLVAQFVSIGLDSYAEVS